MEFIRPEVRHLLWRFRDALIGVVVSVFGLGWGVSSVGFISMLGFTLTVAGALLIFAGLQRARFLTGPDGPGYVAVDEGQVTYFGPLEGGAVHVDDLIQIDLEPGEGGSAWLLLASGQAPLRIPTNAAGADKLFDVFAKLEGIRTGQMLDKLHDLHDRQVMIWRAPRIDMALPSTH